MPKLNKRKQTKMFYIIILKILTYLFVLRDVVIQLSKCISLLTPETSQTNVSLEVY